MKRVVPPPDGGWGWVVALCSLANHLIIFGFFVSLSLVYVSWLEEFHLSKSTTSWTISSCVALVFFSGPMAGSLVDRVGFRLTATIGGLLAGTGLALSFLATSVLFLVATTGIITGVGFGMTYLSSLTSVAVYFDKRRALATGIGLSGTGIGSFLLPPLMAALVDQFGWRGALLVFSSLLLHLCVAGLLMRPLTSGQSCPVVENTLLENDDKVSDDESYKRKNEDNDGKMRETYEGSHAGEETDGNSMLQVEDLQRAYLTPPCTIERTCDKEAGITATDIRANDTSITIGDDGKRHDRIVSTSKLRDNIVPRTLQSKESNDDRIVINSTPANMDRLQNNKIDANRKPERPIFLMCRNAASLMPSGNDASNFGTSQTRTLTPGHAFTSVPNAETKNVKTIDNTNNDKFTRNLKGVSYWRTKVSGVIRSKTEILKEPSYLLFGLSQTFLCLSFLTPVIYMVDRALHSGISKSQGAWLVSCNGVGAISGRLLMGVLADRFRNRKLLFYVTIVIADGVVTMLSPLCGGSVVLHALYAGCFGIFTGACSTVSVVLLVDLVGLHRFANALGMGFVFAGTGHLLGPPLAGFVFDATNSYTASYICQGILLVCSGLLALPIFRLRKSAHY